ncbi:MAG: tRNA (adenosine(37)-N6)-dimethylallyltransferase MiaA, partial [Burkholderiales bacterium]|nr:tRNA (adenosine(37)-N6)-dimethylallyltransferase MiaA [Burkholderiales bacterium]
PGVRAALAQEAAERGWPALHAELAAVDPATAARLHDTDAQRIQRALEVWRQTGRPLSSFHTGPQVRDGRHRLIALEPQDRAWLHRRIDQRFAQMLDAGLLDELQRLRARGDLHLQLASMRCVGYRQAWEALDAGLEGAALRAEVASRGAAATRQLAKRQLTWLRGMARQPLAIDRLDAAALCDAALHAIAT